MCARLGAARIAQLSESYEFVRECRPTYKYIKFSLQMQLMKMQIRVKKPTEEEQRRARSWPTWEKEPSIFPWEYSQNEACLILEGKSIVKTDEGDVEFGAGDFVTFPKGLKCTWEIKEKIRKHYKLG